MFSFFKNPTISEIKKLNDNLNRIGVMIMSALENLGAEVAESKAVTESAIILLAGLKAKLDEAIASGNMSQVQALSDELSTSTDALAAAVSANTPAEPAV